MEDNEMKKVYKLGIVAMLVLFAASCKTTQSYSYHTFETECLGVELDGSQTLKAWGTGRNKKDAVEQAKKNAVRDVIFKGNFTGSKDCFEKPLLLEVNAQEKYANYFNTFFRDGGEFINYISMEDERKHARIADSRNKDQSKYSVVVRVKREELKEKLIKDGILKP